MSISNIIDNLQADDLVEIKRQLSRRGLLAGHAWPWSVGECIHIRTVTHHWIGRIAELGPDYIELAEASWVADSRRWSTMLASGLASEAEVERVPDGRAVVMRAAIVDVTTWHHALPEVSQ